jgi:hypothetical protein
MGIILGLREQPFRVSIVATRRLDLGAVNGDVITDRHLR